MKHAAELSDRESRPRQPGAGRLGLLEDTTTTTTTTTTSNNNTN